MHPILYLISTLITLYTYLVFGWIILELLIYFKIVNAYQPAVRKIGYLLNRLIEPVLKPIRRFLPAMGGLDLSPAVLVIGLQFIQYTLFYYAGR